MFYQKPVICLLVILILILAEVSGLEKQKQKLKLKQYKYKYKYKRDVFDALSNTFNSLTSFFDGNKHHLQMLLQDVDKAGKNFQHWIFSSVKPPQHILNEITDFIKDRLKLIVPGTLWCGDGNTARNQEELGWFQKADSCCRMHDGCFDYISARSSKHGLNNTSLFARLHCSCDEAFYKCLKSQRDIVADNIGATYFNVLSPKCFKEDYPVDDCNSWYRCSYSKKAKMQKVYQWFDNSWY